MKKPTTAQFIDALQHADPVAALDEIYQLAYGDDYGAWEADEPDGSTIVIGTEGTIDLLLRRGKRGEWEIRQEGQTLPVARGRAVARVLLQCMPSLETVAARVAEENQ